MMIDRVARNPGQWIMGAGPGWPCPCGGRTAPAIWSCDVCDYTCTGCTLIAKSGIVPQPFLTGPKRPPHSHT
eukprot:4506330-Prymnesium_polylepis.1